MCLVVVEAFVQDKCDQGHRDYYYYIESYVKPNYQVQADLLNQYLHLIGTI